MFQRINLLNFGLYFVFFADQPALRWVGHRVLRNWNEDSALRSRVGRLFGGLDRDLPTLAELLGLRLPSFVRPAQLLLTRAFPWA